MEGNEMRDYKTRRKLIKTKEYMEYMEARKRETMQRKRETMQKTLDRIGYRKESEYADCVSYLAW